MHCPQECHEHPIQTFAGVASGSFAAPDHEYPSHLELRLTATDAQGLTHTTTRQLDPTTVDLAFATSPSGLTLTVGGADQVTPFIRRVIVGSTNSLSADSPQTLGGITYRWTGWSDGGAQNHDITAPAGTATYTATFVQTTDLAVSQTAAVAPGRVTFTITTRNLGAIVASNVAVVDTLSSKLAFSASGSSPGCAFAAASRQVTCSIGSLAPGGLVTTTIVATNGKGKGQVENTVRVTSTTPDASAANDISTISVRLR